MSGYPDPGKSSPRRFRRLHTLLAPAAAALAALAGSALVNATGASGAEAPIATAVRAPAVAPATAALAATANPPAAVPSSVYGNPYWLANASGVVWPLGGAPDYGSMLGHILAAPAVGISPTPDRHGYWLVGADGGVFSFGDAGFYGSAAPYRPVAPAVGLTAAPGGRGYWVVARDGGVFSFGDAGFYGSMAPGGRPMAALVAAPGGAGYWIIGHDGDVFPFGSAAAASLPAIGLFHSILGPGDQAMEWAMFQIGTPYQWGGTGPSSFDCSGLVMRAWQAAGVNIARVAADQYHSGVNLPFSQLQMGDLVFWATNPADPTTIYHVAMYIGGDHIVEAPYPGTVVQTNWAGGPDFVADGTRP